MNELTPQSLEQWREECETEKRALVAIEMVAADAHIEALADGASPEYARENARQARDAEFARLMLMVMMPWPSQLATQALAYYDNPRGGL